MLGIFVYFDALLFGALLHWGFIGWKLDFLGALFFGNLARKKNDHPPPIEATSLWKTYFNPLQ